MRIMPLDTAHKNFATKFRGFDREKVYPFLGLVKLEMEELLGGNAFLREQLHRFESQVRGLRDKGGAIQ